MGFRERRPLIESLELLRGTRIICYVTQTRGGTAFQIGMDAVPRIFEHLEALGAGRKENTKIDLLLHSNGGDGVVPWRLVTLIREYCKEFSVLIPHRAFSAATLISMGADGIVMHPMGMLGPTDPTVANAFNPADPANPQQKIGISVEDLYSYVSLIKEDLGIRGESELVQAFRTLTEQLHPLALGNVKRFYAQSRMMAKKLLGLHMDEKTEHSAINEIADSLTSKLYFHGHPINRTEALALGLQVKTPGADEERLMWEIYSDFAEEMRIETEFQPMTEFVHSAGAALSAPGQTHEMMLEPVIGACVESAYGQHMNVQQLAAFGFRNPANLQVNVNFTVHQQEWNRKRAAEIEPAVDLARQAPEAAPPQP
jgi:hypothetical protein